MTATPSNSPVLADRAQEGGVLYFSLWTVFKRDSDRDRSAGAAGFDALAEELAAEGTVVRGLYDVSGMRSDADVMVWLHGPAAEKLQEAVRRIRRTGLFAETTIVWSSMGVHRGAEFSKDHWPAYAKGVDPKEWMTVYPFVRSYDWYTLDPAERGKMLRDHGMLGREFPEVLANTVAAFALNDYEWMICLEAPELIDLVDMMRHLRYTDARHHVREEVPFYTGKRIGSAAVAEVLR